MTPMPPTTVWVMINLLVCEGFIPDPLQENLRWHDQPKPEESVKKTGPLSITRSLSAWALAAVYNVQSKTPRQLGATTVSKAGITVIIRSAFWRNSRSKWSSPQAKVTTPITDDNPKTTDTASPVSKSLSEEQVQNKETTSYFSQNHGGNGNITAHQISWWCVPHGLLLQSQSSGNRKFIGPDS
jgi:hypothetical protein